MGKIAFYGKKRLPGKERRFLFLFVFLTFFAFIYLLFSAPIFAKVTGNCANCHTMHNSQGGVTMNGQAAPRDMLMRSSCLGCHAIGGAQRIVTFAGQDTPQVYHTDTSDLAGGNFYPMAMGDDTKGHNVVDFGNLEGTLTSAPPGVAHTYSGGWNMVSVFTCAGSGGCHGIRRGMGSGAYSMDGAHHRDVDGKCDAATEVYNSYRFLFGIKGLENTGSSKWQNAGVSDHNEYFGAITPMTSNPNPPPPTCTNCHIVHGGKTNVIKPLNQTMSGFCATCHLYFHELNSIGGDTTAPFTRHPTDVRLPSTGEYASYTLYNTTAPVARTTVPDSPGSAVQPGTDVVMCLSCHVAHGSNYADLLRWDYTSIIAGGGSSDDGCFVCHTTKDTGG